MKVVRSFSLLLPLVLLTAYTPRHAIYLSVIELKNADQATMTVKVFSDDLLDVLRNFNSSYDLKSPDQFNGINGEILMAYFNKNLTLKINGTVQKPTLNKIEKETDAHFLYFDLNMSSDWKNVEVIGSYFTELFPSQTNVLTVINNEKKQFARLTQSKPNFKITFD